MTRQPAAPPILVTDHAIIRYLERVKGIDLTTIRAEIETIAKRAGSGPGEHRISAGGFTYVIHANRVTTIIPGGMHHGDRRAHAANGVLKDAT
jgi:hypothetical protein